jgi:hypothetical protein
VRKIDSFSGNITSIISIVTIDSSPPLITVRSSGLTTNSKFFAAFFFYYCEVDSQVNEPNYESTEKDQLLILLILMARRLETRLGCIRT